MCVFWGRAFQVKGKPCAEAPNCSHYGWGRGMTRGAVEDEARGVDGQGPERGCSIVYIYSKYNRKAF